MPPVWTRTRLLRAFVAALVPAAVAAADTAAQQPAERRPTITLSGIVFGHYIYRTDDAADGMNKFDIERAELTAQGSVAERTRYRVSIDVIPPAAASPSGPATSWTMRARYAYVEHDILRDTTAGMTLSGRIGMIHNVVISQEEAFFPRWIHRAPVDRAGFFSSSDLGAGLHLTLPERWGTAYANIVNGPGIGSPEVDRFKDVAARLSLTPFARHATPFFRTAAITAWGYNGARGSQFAAGGAGQTGPVDDGLRRDRWGVHLGVREPVLSAALGWSTRVDEIETGANTPEDPREVHERTSRVFSAHGYLRPARLFDPQSRSPLGVIARWDRTAGGPPASDFVLAGLTWDLAARTSVALDFQTTRPRAGGTVVRADAWLFQFTFGF